MAELLLLANCWRANETWCVSIGKRVLSLQNCSWLVERAFFWLPDEVPGEQWGIPSWTLVTMWESSSGSELVRLLERQAENSTSGWRSFWERSSLGYRFSISAFRNVSGTFPERFLKMSVPVGSIEYCPIWTEHSKCGTLSCWYPGTVFHWLCPLFFRKIVLCTPEWFQEQTCFATGCS